MNTYTTFKKCIVSVAIILFIFGSNLSYAQVSGDYRSAASAGWNVASTWDKYNGAAWVNGVDVPDAFTTTCTIQAAHNVTWGSNNRSVASGGILIVQGTLTRGGLNNGILTINGTVQQPDGGVITGWNATRLIFAAGSLFDLQYTTTAGAIPTAGWNSASTCKISGYTTNATAPSGLNQTFGNFTWNTPNLNIGGTVFDLGGVPSSVLGTFTVSSTGAGDGLTLKSAGTATITVGSLVISNGGADLSYFALTNTGTVTLNTGSFTMSNANSTLDFGFSSGSSTMNISGSYSAASGSLSYTSAATSGGFVFNGTSSQSFVSGATVNNAINYVVNDLAIVDFGTSFVDGSGNFTVNATGTIRLGCTATGAIQSGALSGGNIKITGSRTYTGGCTIVFNGGAAQTFGNAFPTDVNITISNANSVSPGQNYTLNSGRTLAFTSGKLSIGTNTLTINGDITGMSAANSFTGSNTSNLTINGSGAVTSNLFFDQTTVGTTNRLLNFTFNRSTGGSATLGNGLEIVGYNGSAYGVITPSLGTLTTGGNLTLISDNSGTANVGTGSGTISGNVVIQRYIPNDHAGSVTGRAYRFLSAPVTSGSGRTIANSWQNSTHITGTGGAANGFDATSLNNSSFFTYNEASEAWVAASNTSRALQASEGYRIFIRGDRTSSLLSGASTQNTAITLSLTGSLFSGSSGNVVSYTAGASPGWNLVGNPYASAYNLGAQFNAVDYTNVSSTIWIWHADLAPNGGYMSHVATAGLIIPSGGAFWLQATAGSPSFLFKETYKTSSAPVTYFKTDPSNQLKIKLFMGPSLSDEFTFNYSTDSSVSKNKDSYDVVKMMNPDVNLSSYYMDNFQMNRSYYPMLTTGLDTILLKLTAPIANYTFTFNGANSFRSNLNFYLIDNYASTITNLNTVDHYSFIRNSSSSSFGANRFKIIAMNNTSALPIQLSKFAADKTSDIKVNLTWTTSSEINNDHFEIEKSIDQVNYSKIGEVKGQGNSLVVSNYNLTDAHPNLKAVNYYRLKQVDFSGKFTYSPILPVDFNNDQIVVSAHSTNVNVFPVPASNKVTVTLTENLFKGDVVVNIYNIVGKLILTSSGTITDPEEGVSQDVSNLSAGVYFIEVSAKSGEFTEKAKFVKE